MAPGVELAETGAERRRRALRALMATHDLTQRQVASLVGYSLDAVKGWCAAPDGPRYREVPERALMSLRRAIAAGEHEKD